MTNEELETTAVTPVLPDALHFQRGNPIPGRIVGATILAFGTIPADHTGIEGGGLVIDYLPRRSNRAKRVVLAFSDLGMWVRFEGTVSTGSSPAEALGSPAE